MYTFFDMLPIIYKYKKLHEKSCYEIMAKYDLRSADLDILFYVAHSGPKNLSKDVVDIGMSKANVSKSVDRLRQKKLVFLKEDQEDRRCVHIEVTDAASPILQEIEDIWVDLGDKLLCNIPQNDMEAVVRAVKQVSVNMDKELLERKSKVYEGVP